MLTRILPSKIAERQIVRITGSTFETPIDFDFLENRSQAINSNIAKRAFDLAIASFAILFIFSWLFPIIAAVIKLTSKGPVFFLQERHGVGNKVFKCIKFRTMKTDSEHLDENGKFKQASLNDERITKIGSFLRKTSLDELPQFINVLKGEMSIVGPRPHAVLMNAEVEQHIEEYNLRHLVRPGITGLAQVNGHRGETKEIEMLQTRVDNDLRYIEVWNNALDFHIVVKTAKNMIVGEENAF
ncbi:sugar transferase [Parasediminibacterium paludis]|uniref:Sugar transferase n=1 Tax=Parasediminibacterium paludis TaxID=908966 RepID=A0ABV8Q231_9BACT